MASSYDAQEELFVLRVKDPMLASKLHAVLNEETTPQGAIELAFTGTPEERKAELRVDGIDYPVAILNLPTVVEAYKTYDDVNLVKIADVGQILLVNPPNYPHPVMEESLDGITPPMRNARARHFKPLPKVDPQTVARVERDLLALLTGKAPPGTTITDYEEEYVIDPTTQVGSWQPVKR